MKKFIALMLVFAALTLSACSSAPAEESTDTTAADNAVEETTPAEETEETAPETEYVRPEDEEYVDYRNVHLTSDPVYNAANKTMILYFEDYQVWYPENAECYVAYISDDAANSITAVPDFTSHPDIKLENGDYKGVVLKMDEAIPAGSFEIMVSFHTYTCSFEMTVE